MWHMSKYLNPEISWLTLLFCWSITTLTSPLWVPQENLLCNDSLHQNLHRYWTRIVGVIWKLSGVRFFETQCSSNSYEPMIPLSIHKTNEIQKKTSNKHTYGTLLVSIETESGRFIAGLHYSWFQYTCIRVTIKRTGIDCLKYTTAYCTMCSKDRVHKNLQKSAQKPKSNSPKPPTAIALIQPCH